MKDLNYNGLKAGQDKYGKLSNGKRLNGSIRFFDAMSGEGQVRGDDGKSYFVHFSDIEGIDKNNYQWPSDKDKKRLQGIAGKKCSFELIEGQAAKVKIEGL